MTPIITGIYSKFTAEPANSLYTALGGRLYHAEAPQNATFPYAVVFIVSHEHDWVFDDEFEEALVQFSIFTNERSAVTAGTLWGYLKSLYDDATITVSGYTQISMIRGQSRLIRDETGNIWHYSVDYDVMVQE